MNPLSAPAAQLAGRLHAALGENASYAVVGLAALGGAWAAWRIARLVLGRLLRAALVLAVPATILSLLGPPVSDHADAKRLTSGRAYLLGQEAYEVLRADPETRTVLLRRNGHETIATTLEWAAKHLKTPDVRS